MDIQTIISTLGLIGIGGIVGGYLQHRWNMSSETELRTRTINEDKYHSILIFMRCILKPENAKQFDINDPNMQKLKDKNEMKEYVKNKLTEFYYNSMLYASDDVLRKMKKFIDTNSESNFIETAIAMRKDLWKNGRTEINTIDFTLKDSAH